MSQPLVVRPTRRAARQIREADAWWKNNRPTAPDAIGEELERAFAFISQQPGIGARATNVQLLGVRRIHLSRVRYHLYYRVRSETVEVLAFWHTSRGSRPSV